MSVAAEVTTDCLIGKLRSAPPALPNGGESVPQWTCTLEDTMHRHSADGERESLRPKAARLDEELPAYAGRAAAEKRPDVLGAEGLLGLQRIAGNAGVSALVEEERSPVHDVVSSGGRPLDPGVRGDMEQRLGHDFGDVRVHDDGAAAASAQAVNAHAYTVGSNIVFQRDRYDPGSQEGRTTLAHELTHVVQQRSGPVDGTAAPGGIKVSDPSDRFEREAAANAERVMAGPTVARRPVSPSAARRSSGTRRATRRKPCRACSCSARTPRRKRSRSRACSSSAQGEEEEEEDSSGRVTGKGG